MGWRRCAGEEVFELFVFCAAPMAPLFLLIGWLSCALAAVREHVDDDFVTWLVTCKQDCTFMKHLFKLVIADAAIASRPIKATEESPATLLLHHAKTIDSHWRRPNKTSSTRKSTVDTREHSDESGRGCVAVVTTPFCQIATPTAGQACEAVGRTQSTPQVQPESRPARGGTER